VGVSLGVSRECLLDILLITTMLVLSLDSCPGHQKTNKNRLLILHF
jgi:hypothetical protein